MRTKCSKEAQGGWDQEAGWGLGNDTPAVLFITCVNF